jgi:hypothetical protein
MPHTLAGSSSANPSSQNFSIAMQFTTRAEILVLVGRLSNCRAVPISRGRQNRAHPWGFTRIIRHGSENGSAASRLERVTGISQLIRVPRWTDFWLENELNSKFNNS